MYHLHTVPCLKENRKYPKIIQLENLDALICQVHFDHKSLLLQVIDDQHTHALGRSKFRPGFSSNKKIK